MRTMIRACAAVLGGLALLAAPAQAQQKLKVGYISSFSGPLAPLGVEVRDGFMLAVDHSGGGLGGVPTEFVMGDDQANPNTGRQLADKMLEQDKVDLVTGVVTGAVVLSVAKPVADAGKFLVSTVSGPAQLAGKQCNPNVFIGGLQNDIPSEIVGKYLTDKGVKRVYLMAANYVAGKDKLAGFKRFFKGEVVNEVYTPFTQLDFSAELAQLRDARPDAVFVFYSGDFAVNFIKQYHQAGLDKQFPLYADISLYDEMALGATGDSAIGGTSAAFWSQEWTSPTTTRFIADFQKKYGRKPSYYAVFGYDTARLIDAALRKTGGSTKDQDAFRAAMMSAKAETLRDNLHFDTNHMPLFDWYLASVAKRDNGDVVLRSSDKVAPSARDSYVAECAMK